MLCFCELPPAKCEDRSFIFMQKSAGEISSNSPALSTCLKYGKLLVSTMAAPFCLQLKIFRPKLRSPQGGSGLWIPPQRVILIVFLAAGGFPLRSLTPGADNLSLDPAVILAVDAAGSDVIPKQRMFFLFPEPSHSCCASHFPLVWEHYSTDGPWGARVSRAAFAHYQQERQTH